MDHGARDELAQMRGAQALAGDPRRGTRTLADSVLGQLGIELLVGGPERVVARMPALPGAGGGPLLILAETVASTAAGLAAGPGRRAFGAELDAALLAPPVPGMVVAEAVPLRLGTDRHTWRVVALDADDVQVLEARCTLGVVDEPT